MHLHGSYWLGLRAVSSNYWQLLFHDALPVLRAYPVLRSSASS